MDELSLLAPLLLRSSGVVEEGCPFEEAPKPALVAAAAVGSSEGSTLLRAFVNLAWMALRTPCADLAKAFRSDIMVSRSIVQSKCCRASSLSSG